MKTVFDKLTFGKHKGKTIEELFAEEEYGYIVWLKENTKFPVDDTIYRDSNKEVDLKEAENEAVIESRHSDWGCR